MSALSVLAPKDYVHDTPLTLPNALRAAEPSSSAVVLTVLNVPPYR